MEAGTTGRLRAARNTTKEDQAIQTLISKGERELAIKRLERSEARRLRLLELEKQREAEDKMADVDVVVPSQRKRKSIIPQTSEEVDGPSIALDLPQKVERVEKRWHEARQTSSQLSSDRSQLLIAVESLTDRLEDNAQDMTELQFDNLVRSEALITEKDRLERQKEELEAARRALLEQASYMKEKGLEWPPPGEGYDETDSNCPDHTDNEEDEEEDDGEEESSEGSMSPGRQRYRGDRGLPPLEKQYLLQKIGLLRQEVLLLKGELQFRQDSANVDEDLSLRDTARLLSEYKTKLEATLSENARISTQVQWLEGGLRRLKLYQEEALQLEDELNTEKRKLQREVRQAKSQAQELELENERLQKRVESLHRKRHQRE